MIPRGLVHRFTVALAVGTALAAGASFNAGAQSPPPADYARDVAPILEANCVRCHSPAKQEAGLMLDAYDDLMRGGDDGPVIRPGESNASRLITLVEGRDKPKMPPKSDLRPEEIATLRAWIDAGAPFSEPAPFTLDGRVPELTPAVSLPAEIPSVAFNTAGDELAIAGYRQVLRLAPSGGARGPALTGLSDQVRALAYSPDGQRLAAAGGTPGAAGEIVIFDTANGSVVHRLSGHRDYVYQVAFSHDGRRLASCGYDRTVRLWDIPSGRLLGVLREHTEAVYAVAFSPDDKWVASGAGDRSVKIWDVEKMTRLYTMTDATDAILTLDFAPDGQHLLASGADKTLRAWRLDASGGRQVRATIAHTAPVLAVRHAPDGRTIATAGADKRITLWDAKSGAERLSLEAQADWAQGLAWSPDGQRLAVGRYDGTVSIYDAVSGKRIADPLAPAADTLAVNAAR